MKIAAAIAIAGLLTACSAPLPVADNTTAVEVNGTEEVMPSEGDVMQNASTATAELARYSGDFVEGDFLGHWVGVEGMVLDVAKARTPGHYTVTMQWSLDDRGTFDGESVSDPMAPGIAFRRGGEDLTLRRTDGDATGLKYLAGKKACLTVKPGEGYCRN